MPDAGSGHGRRLLGAPGGLLLIACLSALLAACGSSGAGQAASGSAGLLRTLENWSALQTPVDQALGILTQQCMAQRGYDYYPLPQAGQPGGEQIFATPLFGSSLWLGPQSLAWRLVNGWGLYEQTMQQLSQPGGFSGAQPQEVQVMQSLRGRAMQRYINALYGGKTMKIRIPGLPHYSIRIGGCNTTAGAKLFGSVAASVAVPQYGQSILYGDVQSKAARSPAVRAGEASWVACVHARTKLTVRSPSELFLHFWQLYQTKGPTPAVHDQELKAAVADLDCQRRAHLPQAVRKAALSAVAHLPAPVVGELESLLSALQQARTRAQKEFSHPTTTPALTTGPARTQSSGSGGALVGTGSGRVSRSLVVVGG